MASTMSTDAIFIFIDFLKRQCDCLLRDAVSVWHRNLTGFGFLSGLGGFLSWLASAMDQIARVAGWAGAIAGGTLAVWSLVEKIRLTRRNLAAQSNGKKVGCSPLSAKTE